MATAATSRPACRSYRCYLAGRVWRSEAHAVALEPRAPPTADAVGNIADARAAFRASRPRFPAGSLRGRLYVLTSHELVDVLQECAFMTPRLRHPQTQATAGNFS